MSYRAAMELLWSLGAELVLDRQKGAGRRVWGKYSSDDDEKHSCCFQSSVMRRSNAVDDAEAAFLHLLRGHCKDKRLCEKDQENSSSTHYHAGSRVIELCNKCIKAIYDS